MKTGILTLAVSLLASSAFANDKSVIRTDMKFLCEINKIEKSLNKDTSIDPADLAERIYAIKEAGLRDEATKIALKGISNLPASEQSKTWRQFAKDHKIKVFTANCN